MEINGELLIKIARNSIESYFESKSVKEVLEEMKLKEFGKKYGIFVTLHKYPSMELRGCIGVVKPVYDLYEGVAIMAREAAFNDPRFYPLNKEEVNKVIVDISLLGEPKIIKAKEEREKIEKVKIGKGIILEYSIYNALFLPQVWEELKKELSKIKKEVSDEELKIFFLEQLSLKASLDYDLWKKANLYEFSVISFKEERPNGKVIKEVY